VAGLAGAISVGVVRLLSLGPSNTRRKVDLRPSPPFLSELHGGCIEWGVRSRRGKRCGMRFDREVRSMVSAISKPAARAGVFGIGLEAYWAQFSGLKERLEGYQRHVESTSRYRDRHMGRRLRAAGQSGGDAR
jgi:hypothetical protein